jgi:hypothetical protein
VREHSKVVIRAGVENYQCASPHSQYFFASTETKEGILGNLRFDLLNDSGKFNLDGFVKSQRAKMGSEIS